MVVGLGDSTRYVQGFSGKKQSYLFLPCYRHEDVVSFFRKFLYVLVKNREDIPEGNLQSFVFGAKEQMRGESVIRSRDEECDMIKKESLGFSFIKPFSENMEYSTIFQNQPSPWG